MAIRFIFIIFFHFLVNVAYAHQPDFSSLMIYEQNGKSILVLKSSLTAFEGEIDFHFKKNAYKTPEEFIKLVIKHFENNCLVIINNDTIRLINPNVILGHETTLFAELEKKPNKIKTLYLKNTFFKDMYNNQCEFIFSAKDLPQYQHILNNENKQEVELRIENNEWLLTEPKNFLLQLCYCIIGVLFLVLLIVFLRRNVFKFW